METGFFNLKTVLDIFNSGFLICSKININGFGNFRIFLFLKNWS